MAVKRIRRHFSISNGRQRFQAEEKCVRKRSRAGILNGIGERKIKTREYQIDKQIECEYGQKEPRPRGLDRLMICVPEIEPTHTSLAELERAQPHAHGPLIVLPLLGFTHCVITKGALAYEA